MPTKSRAELEAIRRSVKIAGRLSDSIFRLGPLSIGLDGILSWIPGAGELYGSAAAVFILVQGARAGVPIPTLAIAAALMGARTTISAIPIAGAAFADMFTAHRWAAQMIVRAIDRRIGRGEADAGDDFGPPLRWAWS